MKKLWPILLILTLIMTLLVPGPVFAKGPPEGRGGGGGEEEPTAVNNLSFPVIAVDGFGITEIPEALFSFAVPYPGPYDGLSVDEQAIVDASPVWYAQKTEGNLWQADIRHATLNEPVTFIDWGDNIESVNPKLRTPFRLEITLYQALVPDMLGETMTRFFMAVLSNPSSPDEVQGTNNVRFENEHATIISTKPKLVVQFLGSAVPEGMTWSGTQWVKVDGSVPQIQAVTFAPELNVGGKYIFGASEGGWKPENVGFYRITFYIPNDSTIDLSTAVISNYATEEASIESEESETGAATPIVVGADNLTYVDVQVTGGGGGGSKRPR